VLKGDETVIGRDTGCHGRIALAHISSKHCVLLLRNGKILVKDLSRNGTYVNNKKIGIGRFEFLSNGDTLSLTPPGEQSVESVAFVVHDSSALSHRSSIFTSGMAGFSATLVKMLGKGSFGEVWLGIANGNRRAVKIVRKLESNTRLYEEVKLLDKLRHPHIVGIHQVWDGPNHLAITLDLAEGGDLEQLLRSTGPLSESDSKSLLVQVLNALAYLHGEKVIHRDLKPENILLKLPLASKAVPHLLITDFGLSKCVDSHLTPATTICGTPFYVAPEIVHADVAKQLRAYDESVDLWSTGIIMYRLLNGCVPWETNRKLAEQILAAAYQRPAVRFSASVTAQCRKFFDKLVVERGRRVSATDALKDEWFEEARRQVAESVLWDGSQTQGLIVGDESVVPDRFERVVTPAWSAAQAAVNRSSPPKRARKADDEGNVKRHRPAGHATDDSEK